MRIPFDDINNLCIYAHVETRRETQLRRTFVAEEKLASPHAAYATSHIFPFSLGERRIHPRSSPFTTFHVYVPYVLHTYIYAVINLTSLLSHS